MSEILINKAAYFHNLKQIVNKVGSAKKIIAVFKDNAYGHGAFIMASLAKEFGIEFACVRTAKEADELGEIFQNILVISHIPNGAENLQYIYAVNELGALKIIKSGAKIHLAIDTLMHRNGICQDEIKAAFLMAKERNLRICGAYTHFRCADELSNDYYVQKSKFNSAKELIKRLAIEFYGSDKEIIFHSHNSAATERSLEFENEYIRVGIAQYGYSQFNDSLGLKKVLSLWADKISSRMIKKGQSIGYGAVFTAKEDMKISTYDLGYADGLIRYNGIGDLWLGSKVKMLGRMSMDNFTCKDVGERICVFDDANVMANFFNTINYEILVKLSPQIPRRVI